MYGRIRKRKKSKRKEEENDKWKRIGKKEEERM